MMIVDTRTALSYRSMYPDDVTSVWLACAFRNPRPGSAACREIVDTQVDVDQGIADQLALDGNETTRRLLAFSDGEAVGLVTVKVPADSNGIAVAEIDPIVSAWSGEMEADARSWIMQLGVKNWSVTVISLGATDPVPERPLVFIQ